MTYPELQQPVVNSNGINVFHTPPRPLCTKEFGNVINNSEK